MSAFSNPDKGKLTIENFAEFSVDMMNTALRYGQAGEEIIDDVAKEFEMPDADAKTKRKGMEREQYTFQHSDTNKLTDSGRMQYEQALKMHFEGLRLYNKHRGELSWYLLDCLSPQLTTKVRAHPEFELARRERNSFIIWRIIKFCCTAEGGHSLMVDIIKLFRLKHDKDVAAYITEYRTTTTRIVKKQPEAKELIEALFDGLFILNLNQAEFPQIISDIYRKEKFPGREELMSELLRYETTVNQVARLTKDEQRVTANLAARSRVCWNCNTSHEGKCKKPPVQCSKCHKVDHLPTYCEQFTAWKNNKDRERCDEASRASSEKTAATRPRRPTGGRKPMRKGGQYTPKKRIQAHLVTEDLEVDDEALYEQYDEASVYEEGDENTLAYTVSIEERQQQLQEELQRRCKAGLQHRWRRMRSRKE